MWKTSQKACNKTIIKINVFKNELCLYSKSKVHKRIGIIVYYVSSMTEAVKILYLLIWDIFVASLKYHIEFSILLQEPYS